MSAANDKAIKRKILGYLADDMIAMHDFGTTGLVEISNGLDAEEVSALLHAAAERVRNMPLPRKPKP